MPQRPFWSFEKTMTPLRYEAKWVVNENPLEVAGATFKTDEEARTVAKEKSFKHEYGFAEAAALNDEGKAIETWKYIWGRPLEENQAIVEQFQIKAWTASGKVLERLVLEFGEQVSSNDLIAAGFEGKKGGHAVGLALAIKVLSTAIQKHRLPFEIMKRRTLSKEVSYGIYSKTT